MQAFRMFLALEKNHGRLLSGSLTNFRNELVELGYFQNKYSTPEVAFLACIQITM